jgi:hypothetical protein
MNLYKIKVKHLSQKDSHTSIERYTIFENESDLYDALCKDTYWDDKTSYFILNNISDEFKEGTKFDYADTDYEVEGQDYSDLLRIWKWFVISTQGEINSDWANYDDLYYGKTHYGWELVKEGIGNMEIQVLKLLNIIN